MSDECGIYCIKNLVNENIYIGRALRLKHRRQEHLYSLKRNKHHNYYLQDLYNNYGKNIIIFEVLEYIDWIDIFWDKKYINNILKDREIFWYNKFPKKQLYNIAPPGDSMLGFKHSAKTKLLWSEQRKGRKATEETRYKLSCFQKSRTIFKSPSKETREKLAKHNRKPIYQVDKITNEIIKEWSCATDAATILFKKRSKGSAIMRACRGELKTAYGYKWQYV